MFDHHHSELDGLAAPTLGIAAGLVGTVWASENGDQLVASFAFSILMINLISLYSRAGGGFP